MERSRVTRMWVSCWPKLWGIWQRRSSSGRRRRSSSSSPSHVSSHYHGGRVAQGQRAPGSGGVGGRLCPFFFFHFPLTRWRKWEKCTSSRSPSSTLKVRAGAPTKGSGVLGAEGRVGAGEDLWGIWETGTGGIREGVENGVGLGWERNERLCSRRDRAGDEAKAGQGAALGVWPTCECIYARLSLVLGPLTSAAGGRGWGCVCLIRVHLGLNLAGAAGSRGLPRAGREGSGAEGRAAGAMRSAPARRGARGRDAGLRAANPLRRRAPALPQPPLLFINDSSLLNQQQVCVAPEERSHPGFVSLSSIHLKRRWLYR